MSRTFKILDGCTLMDVSKAEGGYNYYGYVRVGTSGEWVIMRELTDGTQYRYAVGASDYEANWSGRTGLTYKIPVNL